MDNISTDTSTTPTCDPNTQDCSVTNNGASGDSGENSDGETDHTTDGEQTGTGEEVDPNSGEGETGTGDGNDPGLPDDEPIVDPAFEENKQTCIATCGLKCKSESSDKKDACIDLCFNQCAASIALVSSKRFI